VRKRNHNHLLKQFCILLLAFCIFCAFGAVSASAAENTPCTSTDGCTGGYVNGICDVCNGYEQPPQGEYDIYEISNAGQLYWFAEHVNIRGNNKISGKLMADIDLENRTWYPIGVYKDVVDASGTVATVEFKGDFDGNYHTVSNFTATGNGSQGLLGYTSGDTRITNIGVINATVSGWNAGAILGFMGSVHDSFAVNCTVTADTASEENVTLVHAGVIAGTQSANVYGSFAYDCAVNASESWVNAATLAPVGGKNAYTCYYGRVTTNVSFRTSTGETEMTAEQFASGEVAYLLGEQWGQTLSENGDKHPVFANGENTVYRGYLTCADTEYTYSNTEEIDYTHAAFNQNGFCSTCGEGYQPAVYNGEKDCYEISNAGQLYWFSEHVAACDTQANAVLTADIVVNEGVLNDDGTLNGDGSGFRKWTSITSGASIDTVVTFDGQGYTVSGLYINSGDGVIVGMFSGLNENSKVMNLGIIDSYFCVPSGSVGGVVGSNYGGTILNCYNTGTVVGGDPVGGVVGSNYGGTILNCYNTGTVSGEKYVGGVVGYNSSAGTVTNCYYLLECAKDGDNIAQFGIGNGTQGFATADTAGMTTGMEAEQFTSGMVTYYLNGGVTNGTQAFYQTVGTGLPTFRGNTVYYGYFSCTEDAVAIYTNDSRASETKPEHKFNFNGFCEYGCYQSATLNESGYYEIGNAGQLFWFAQQVNVEGNREIKGILTADIDLENRPWTPIGSTGEENNNFRGVFDGQNHTIKGLYVEGGRAGLGFFGEVRTGTVKNFTIYGEVIVNTQHDYVGGVVGSICGVNGETDLERNGAIIQNITSYVNLTAKAHGVGMIGGFVGYANHQSLIENCSWYGTFDAGIYRVDSGAGGFIGKIQENTSEVTIRNCAAYGTIKTNYEKNSFNNNATIYMGGFLSFSNTNAQTTLENCLFAGKFERGENLTDQAFLGAFGTLRSVNAIKNCYYLGDGVLEAVHSNSDLKPGSDNVEIISVTRAQLLSGEVAYKLGEHFGQILEGENRQSYPVLGGEAVPSSRFEIYGQQLNIGGDLSMKYYVMGYAPAFNSGALYMEFSHNGVKTKVYAGEPNADGFYVFVLEGINPQCMGDSIRAMLYYNETEVTSHGCEDGKEYSVEKNLLNLLEKYKDDTALVALINDTLAYGEAASAYKKHQTMTGNTYTENSSNREIPVSEAQVADVITGYTVRFGTAISIIIEVNPSAFEDTIYKVECNGTELRNFPSPNSPLYKVTNIAATDFDKEWEFVVRSTNPMGDVYGTVVISVNDYLYGISQSSTDEKMVNLAKALYNYGVSAKIYNHVKTGEGDHYYVDNVCACGKLETIDATAMTADELKAAVADQLAAGETDITVTLKPDASAEMVTAIRRAICDTEGVADGSINLTLKGVTTIPGTTNWDGVAFGPGDIYDEAGEIVDQELVTQLASINLPDVTEIGAQAFYFCENLLTVSAPKAQTIGAQAFGYTALTSVEFPELTTIPTDMFSGTWTLSSAKFPKVTTIEQGGLLVGGKFNPENNPTPFPLELTAEGDITFNGSYHFNIAERNYTGKVDLVLNIDKKDQVTFHDDGTATWQVREDLSYTFKSITFVGE